MQYIIFPVSAFMKGLMMARIQPKHVAVNKLIKNWWYVQLIWYTYLYKFWTAAYEKEEEKKEEEEGEEKEEE